MGGNAKSNGGRMGRLLRLSGAEQGGGGALPKRKAKYGRSGLTDEARRERLESGEAWLRSHGWVKDTWGDWHQGSLTCYHTWQHGWQAMGLPGGCPTPAEALARAAHRAGRESPPE